MGKKKKKEKMLTDKGFELFYANLSTRRQLIRNIWMTGLGIVLFIVGWVRDSFNKNLLLVLIVVFLMSQAYQIGRNYMAWTDEKKKLEKQKLEQEKLEKYRQARKQQKEQRDKQLKK